MHFHQIPELSSQDKYPNKYFTENYLLCFFVLHYSQSNADIYNSLTAYAITKHSFKMCTDFSGSSPRFKNTVCAKDTKDLFVKFLKGKK